MNLYLEIEWKQEVSFQKCGISQDRRTTFVLGLLWSAINSTVYVDLPTSGQTMDSDQTSTVATCNHVISDNRTRDLAGITKSLKEHYTQEFQNFITNIMLFTKTNMASTRINQQLMLYSN